MRVLTTVMALSLVAAVGVAETAKSRALGTLSIEAGIVYALGLSQLHERRSACYGRASNESPQKSIVLQSTRLLMLPRRARVPTPRQRARK